MNKELLKRIGIFLLMKFLEIVVILLLISLILGLFVLINKIYVLKIIGQVMVVIFFILLIIITIYIILISNWKNSKEVLEIEEDIDIFRKIYRVWFNSNNNY
jgi:hypothetical protein